MGNPRNQIYTEIEKKTAVVNAKNAFGLFFFCSRGADTVVGEASAKQSDGPTLIKG